MKSPSALAENLISPRDQGASACKRFEIRHLLQVEPLHSQVMGDPARLTLSNLPVAPTDLAADIPQVNGTVVGRVCPPACRVDPAQVPDIVMNKTGSYRKKKGGGGGRRRK